jgi:menaquinol-cytochrome c reductase iron-sulfur subunit
VPEDGVPRKFPVLASRVDAWNKSPETAIGAVYLRRAQGEKLRAFNVVCPHAGCFVDFLASKDSFLCPCHNSTFALDGKINDPRSPSPRGMDELEVEVRNDSEVWVKFQNFRAGVVEKIPA